MTVILPTKPNYKKRILLIAGGVIVVSLVLAGGFVAKSLLPLYTDHLIHEQEYMIVNGFADSPEDYTPYFAEYINAQEKAFAATADAANVEGILWQPTINVANRPDETATPTPDEISTYASNYTIYFNSKDDLTAGLDAMVDSYIASGYASTQDDGSKTFPTDDNVTSFSVEESGLTRDEGYSFLLSKPTSRSEALTPEGTEEVSSKLGGSVYYLGDNRYIISASYFMGGFFHLKNLPVFEGSWKRSEIEANKPLFDNKWVKYGDSGDGEGGWHNPPCPMEVNVFMGGWIPEYGCPALDK